LLPIGLTGGGSDWTPVGLWLAVVASGLYHGLNPGMGWPLAVSAGLMAKDVRSLLTTLWPLSIGHLLAMLLILLPFSLLVALVWWRWQIQLCASLLVIGFGLYRVLTRRHPSPNTVHFTIRMAALKSMRVVGCGVRGRNG